MLFDYTFESLFTSISTLVVPRAHQYFTWRWQHKRKTFRSFYSSGLLVVNIMKDTFHRIVHDVNFLFRLRLSQFCLFEEVKISTTLVSLTVIPFISKTSICLFSLWKHSEVDEEVTKLFCSRLNLKCSEMCQISSSTSVNLHNRRKKTSICVVTF